jgi:hypothetical protein
VLADCVCCVLTAVVGRSEGELRCNCTVHSNGYCVRVKVGCGCCVVETDRHWVTACCVSVGQRFKL